MGECALWQRLTPQLLQRSRSLSSQMRASAPSSTVIKEKSQDKKVLPFNFPLICSQDFLIACKCIFSVQLWNPCCLSAHKAKTEYKSCIRLSTNSPEGEIGSCKRLKKKKRIGGWEVKKGILKNQWQYLN